MEKEEEGIEGIYERKDLSGIGGEAEQRAVLEQDAERVQGSLDLEKGRVMRVVEYELGERGRRLLLVIHHLVVDGVSWRILLEDLERGYEQLRGGEEIKLGAKSSSYKRWAEKMREYGEGEEVEKEEAYWLGQEWEKVGRVPLDYEEAEVEKENVEASRRSVVVELGEEETRELLQKVPGVYHTQINDALLLALGRSLGEWMGGKKVLVEMEGHGREELFSDVEVSRTVGWFTSIYPVVLGVEGKGEMGGELKKIKEQLRRIPQRGIGYGVLRYGAGRGEEGRRGGWEKVKSGEISFNYLGQLDQVLEGSKLLGGAEEGSGEGKARENRRRYVLEVSGRTVGGKLRMEWSYSERLHRRDTVEKVASRYVESLRELIRHCRQTQAGGYTPSDFPLANLEQDEFRQIAALLEKKAAK
jgi:non-ribosomal peptide synthase protein (TIGR01720 family)